METTYMRLDTRMHKEAAETGRHLGYTLLKEQYLWQTRMSIQMSIWTWNDFLNDIKEAAEEDKIDKWEELELINEIKMIQHGLKEMKKQRTKESMIEFIEAA